MLESIAKIHKLSNGVTVLTCKDPRLRMVEFQISARAGKITETKRDSGISHFLEHMSFHGIDGYSTQNAISGFIEKHGACINAYTATDHTCYHVNVMPSFLKECIDVLCKIYTNPMLSEDRLESEKDIVCEEIVEDYDDPYNIAYNLLLKQYYDSSPLSMNTAGSIENVRSFTRDDLINIRNKYYTPNNTLVVIAGNFDNESELLDLLEDNLTFNSNVQSEVIPDIKALETRYKPKSGIYIENIGDYEQVHTFIGFKGPSAIDINSQICYNIAVQSLGVLMSSRLFKNIREEQGLCYTVNATCESELYAGMSQIYTCTSLSKVEKALVSISDELKLFRDGITIDEFERSKNYAMASILSESEKSYSQAVHIASMYESTKDVYTMDDQINLVNKVSYEDVNNAVRKYVDLSNVVCTCVGSDLDSDKLTEVFKNSFGL